jgi:hypothetical protein
VALIVRILMVMLAFLAASVAAATVMAIGVLPPEWMDIGDAAVSRASLIAIIGLSAVFISASTLIPAMLLIALAEGFRLRSALFYGIIGAAAALACYDGFGHGAFALRHSLALFDRESEVVVAAGIAAGLVYWVLAGRNAGEWRERTDPAPTRP